MAMKESDFEGANLNHKKKCLVKCLIKYPAFEQELVEFVLQHEADGLFEDLVMEKAARMIEKHNIPDASLKLSNGWFHKFKKRNNLKCHILHGESGSVCVGDLSAAQAAL